MDLFWLYEYPAWVEGILLVVILLAAVELGYRIGLFKFKGADDAGSLVKGDVTLGSMLALLGLILAFTYSFGLSRADLRKAAVIDEANAIGTAFLKADLAPEPGRTRLQQNLLDYAGTRIATSERVHDRDSMERFIDTSLAVQSQLWPATKEALEGDWPAAMQAQLVNSITEVLDMHTKRRAHVYDRLPAMVFLLLIFIAASSLGVAAHNAGLHGRMNRARMTIFSVILGTLIFVILDFDRPLVGTIQVNNHPLEAIVDDMTRALEQHSADTGAMPPVPPKAPPSPTD